MATREPVTSHKRSSSKIKDPKRPTWIGVLYWIAMIGVVIFGILLFIGFLIKYTRLVSK